LRTGLRPEEALLPADLPSEDLLPEGLRGSGLLRRSGSVHPGLRPGSGCGSARSGRCSGSRGPQGPGCS